MGKIETFKGMAAMFFESMLDRLLPSLERETAKATQAVASEDQRLVEFSGAPAGYQEQKPSSQ